jgi:hypothetical protein
VPGAETSSVLAASIEAGADVARASDHRPVVLDLRVR